MIEIYNTDRSEPFNVLKGKLNQRLATCFNKCNGYLEGYVEQISYYTSQPLILVPQHESEKSNILRDYDFDDSISISAFISNLSSHNWYKQIPNMRIYRIRGNGTQHAPAKGIVKLYEVKDRENNNGYEIELLVDCLFPNDHFNESREIPKISQSPNRQKVAFANVQHVGFSIYTTDIEGGDFSLHLLALDRVDAHNKWIEKLKAEREKAKCFPVVQ